MKKRYSLWILIVPYIVYIAAIPFVNRIEPRIFGISFLTFWMFVGVIVTPLSIWLTSILDPVYKSGKNGGE